MRYAGSSFNGERLRAARQFRGMTIGEVAKEIGLTTQSVSQFEKNKTEPKVENLFRIVNLLGFPREYFYEKDASDITVGNTYFRSLSTTTAKNRKMQIEKVKLLAKIYEGIEEYITFPEFNIGVGNLLDVEELAHYVREQWQLGDEPIFNIIDIMEQYGIIVANSFDSNNDIDAYCHVEMINNSVVPIVVLGNDRNYFRQQFSAAHELGHVLTDGIFEVEELTKLEYKNMEQYMNQFAGALLIPKNMFLNDLAGRGKTEFRFYVELKKKYRVSAAALIVRAKQLGAISMNQYQYLMKQRSNDGYIKEEPYDKQVATCEPRYLKHAMKMLIEDRRITGTEFMRVLQKHGLSINSHMVEELLGLDEGYLDKFSNPGKVFLFEKEV